MNWISRLNLIQIISVILAFIYNLVCLDLYLFFQRYSFISKWFGISLLILNLITDLYFTISFWTYYFKLNGFDLRGRNRFIENYRRFSKYYYGYCVFLLVKALTTNLYKIQFGKIPDQIWYTAFLGIPLFVGFTYWISIFPSKTSSFN